MPIRPLLWLLAAVILVGSTALHAGDRHFLWQLEGPRSTVHLLGSVHALRPDDYPLADPIEQAFREADAVVLETALSPETTGEALTGLGSGKGPGLADQLGEKRYDRARELAERQEIDLASLSELDPWVAGMVIMQGALRRAGYHPRHGVDAHFQRRATEAETALETAERELEALERERDDLQGAAADA
ncbi:MAG: TraB/GumN family protein [Thiohalorhabdaceae bacterium]